MELIYYNGDILTMEPQPMVEAVLVRDGIIAATGRQRELAALAAPDAQRVNLEGCTLMPAFIDAHSHITGYARTFGMVNLTGASSQDEVKRRIDAFRQEQALSPGEWIIGYGYDHNRMKEQRHPDKLLLDGCTRGHPALISHISGHMGVLNSAALQALGVTCHTPDPGNGVIGRLPGSAEPDGYLEEGAFTSLTSGLPGPDERQQMELLERAQDAYLQYGITMIQDGVTRAGEWEMLRKASLAGRLKIDVVSYVDQSLHASLPRQYPLWVNQYHRRLKIGGYKIFLDGSPQGRTAWFSRPYEGSRERGYPAHSNQQVRAFFEEAASRSMQMLAHCNGDAAAEQMISMWEGGVDHFNLGLRPVMIHSQFVRKDQLRRMARLGMVASFFPAHIYYWGDVHVKNLGVERACGMSPARSALEAGTVYTFHQDTPVLLPDMLFTVWTVVNRVSRQGEVLGAGERIPVLDALRGVTINAAYQYFEEHVRGSIRPGKLADFVVLDRNPLKADPMDIKDIRILQTIKEGRLLYQRPSGT